jgi:tellurite resistance protein
VAGGTLTDVFLFDVAPDHGLLLLRAMHAVCVADGAVTQDERALLESARDALGLGPTCDVASLEPIRGPELAAMRFAAGESERFVQAAILMAVIDGEVRDVEVDVVSELARALHVDEPRVHNITQLARGRVDAMKWDLTRKGYARDEFLRTAHEEGVRGLYRTFGPIVGLGGDADLARRYNDLGKLPAGTLGRSYWEFIVANDLSFPGEKNGLGERGVWHDMLHVMGGYPITPVGEAEVVAFMAGFRREDPFFWLFTVALQFQIGVRISPFAPGVPHQIDPKRFVRHHARGARVKTDLSADWDFRADYARPLEDVRREHGVTPLE